VNSNLKFFNPTEPFKLEKGGQIENFRLAYQTSGEINADRSNVVWVFHAFSANADVLDWWQGLFGAGRLYDPKDYFIICVNVIYSPYGSSHPGTIDAPLVTVRDVTRSQLMLADSLGIRKVHTLIGASYGGSQVLEFASVFKGEVDQMILMSCAARESAWSIAIHESHRMALKADSTFGEPDGGREGIRAARAMGMVLYRTRKAYLEKHTDTDDRLSEHSVNGYLHYKGDTFADRFDALCYYHLCNTLDTHNLGRDRGGLEQALSNIKFKALIIGVDSDNLIPPENQEFIAEHLPNASFQLISSDYGHDAFLVETEKIEPLIRAFYEQNETKQSKVKAS